MRLRHSLLLLALLPVACSEPAPAPAPIANKENAAVAPDQELAAPILAENTTSPVQIAKVEGDYLGKWIGPEGLVLDVKPRAGGGVTITNQWTLDDHGTFDGSVTAEGLRWTRNGAAVTAVASDGDATGMKWLAGKRDCLTVEPGEGYCRD